MAQPSWSKALADAKKILGKDAKIPIKKMDTVFKDITDANKINPDFKSASESLENMILNYQNAYSKVKNSLKQASDELTDDDFGLDEKNADDKKKISQAQADFKQYFDPMMAMVDDDIKKLDELDKHLIHIKSYKGPQFS